MTSPNQNGGSSSLSTESVSITERTYDEMIGSLDATGIAILVIDLEQRLARGFGRARFLLNVSDPSTDWVPLGQYFKSLPSDERSRLEMAIQRSETLGTKFESTFRATGSDGQDRWIVARGTPTPEAQGVSPKIHVALIDITEARHGDEERRAGERRRELAAAAGDIGSSNIDISNFRLDSDPRFWRIFGGVDRPITYEEAFSLIHEEDRESVRVAVEAAYSVDNPVPYDMEYRVIRPDGSFRWISGRGRANFSTRDDGKVEAVSLDGTVTDITDRKLTELTTVSAQRQRRLYDAALANTPDLVYVWDLSHRFIYANPSLLGMWGRTWDEAIGLHCNELGYEPWHAEMHDREIYQVVATKESVRGVVPFQGAYGNRMYDYILVPVIGENGEVEAVAGTTRDVTDRMEVEEALRIEKERMTSLFNISPSAIAVIRGDELRFEYANDAYLEVVDRDAVVGQTLFEALPEITNQGFPELLRQVMETRKPFSSNETPVLLKPTAESLERMIYVNLLYQPMEASEGDLPAVFVHAVDVTDQVIARNLIAEREKTLRASEERFRQLVDLSPSTVWTANSHGIFTYFSQDFYENTGLSSETALPEGWKSVVHPYDVDEITIKWEEARHKEAAYYAEFRIKNKDGQYRWMSARAVPLRDESEGILGWLGSNSDIDERKNAEATLQRKVEERTLELQNAVRDAEGFNYSISHDLRSPLRAIAATSRILIEDAGPRLSEEHRQLLDRQAQSAGRLGRLIDELLQLSRLGRVEIKRQSVDMTQEARTVATLQTECEIKIQEGMVAEGDSALIHSIWQNLIGNACKFSPAGSAIRVGQDRDVFFVQDEGIGFDMVYAPKIFLPFERLVSDDEFPGTGIGLANVKRIVERHGGSVWAESEVGKGSTFFFTLS